MKRAVLQRDLWLIFNTLIGDYHDFAEPKLSQEEAGKARERLQLSLAEIIRRVALIPQEIRDLPDNYAAAVTTTQFARSADPQRRKQPYLPADLLALDGPWTCVGRTDSRTAPQHLRDENPFSNSVFLVFVRLPDGRAAVADSLKRGSPFPQGTELALVRQAILNDTSLRIVPTTLTESVQIRIIPTEITFEFRLSRKQLFAGQTGGLRPSGDGERDFKTGFLAHMWDEFEYRGAFNAERRFPESGLRPMKQCSVCHNARFHEFQSGAGGMRGGNAKHVSLGGNAHFPNRRRGHPLERTATALEHVAKTVGGIARFRSRWV